ncbi:hypothetical protein GCM10028808_24950 [Spirosoma migulaei]
MNCNILSSWLCIVTLISYLGIVRTTHAQTLTTTNLPIVIINTEGGTITDEPGIVCSMTIINNASGINNVTDPANEYNGKIKVEYRGCSSQNYPKKPLGIELRSTTAVTTSIDVPLFGFPEESDWVLNPSYIDKTFMRDVVAYHMANVSGRYASRTKYVEVIINGSYQGIFIFEEKVKRDPGRININKLDPTDLGSNSITGGYVVKIDKACGNFDPTHQWQSAYSSPGGTQKHYWMTDYPNDANIVSQQFTYIKTYINSFETMMSSSSYCSGYNSYIADSTFVDYMLVEELSSNADAYRFSTYLAKERNSKGGKLSAGPVWDFNLAFGFLTSAFDGNAQSYQGWRYTAPGDPSFPVPFWWGKLLACPAFGTNFVSRYQKLRQTVWSTPTLMAFIDAQYALLNQGAFSRNFQKWPIIGVSTWNDSPSYNGATLQNEIDYLKTWLTNRLDWMDNSICGFSGTPTATLSTTQSAPIEEGQSAPLTLTFTNASPWTYTLSTGQSGTATSSTAIVTVTPTQTTPYLIQFVKNGCGTGTSSGTALVTVLPALADLSLALSSNQRVVAIGDTVSLDLALSNAGPKTAHSIQIEDRLPAGLAFVGSSLSTITQNNDVITITTDSLAAGQTAHFSYNLTVTNNGSFINAAQIKSSSRTDPDSQPNSGTGDGQDDEALVDLRTRDTNGQISVSPNPNQTPLPPVQSNQPLPDPAKTDLSLAISSDNLVINPTHLLSVSLTVSNRGGAAASNITVQMLLPDGWQVTNTAALTINGQTVSGTISAIPANSSGTLILSIQPTTTGTLKAQIASATPNDSDSTPNNGYINGEDDEAILSLRVSNN